MKNNIKFVLKVLAVLCIALCLLALASELYKNGETYEGTYMGIEKFESVPEKIDYANFGPSYGMSCFKYDTIEKSGKTGFNFALTMQDLYHDYALYKTYEESFNEGAIVAIPLSYFSFCSNADSVTGTRYYKLLPKKYIKNYTLENDISTKYIPVYGKGSALIRDLINDMMNSIMSDNIGPDEADSDETELNETTDVSKLTSDSKTRVFTVENGNLKMFGKYIKTNEEILVNWIKEMQEKGLKPVILLTPYWHEYANGFDAELLNEGYSEPVSRVVEKTGVEYINFCSEEFDEYTHTPEYFNNCDHVSKEGTKEFMELYMNCLTERGLIK